MRVAGCPTLAWRIPSLFLVVSVAASGCRSAVTDSLAVPIDSGVGNDRGFHLADAGAIPDSGQGKTDASICSPAVSAFPEEFDFGSVHRGIAHVGIMVASTGCAPLLIAAVTIEPTGAGFEAYTTATPDAALENGAVAIVSMVYHADRLGPFRGRALIQTNVREELNVAGTPGLFVFVMTGVVE